MAIYKITVKKAFEPGRIVSTSAAKEAVPEPEMFQAISRHLLGDWGDVSEADRSANEYALWNELRLISSYHTKNNVKYSIITEADRSATTVLLPDEY